jgi:amino-acid N-acetyltransferase
MKITQATEYREAIVNLLRTEKLPADDLPGALDDFRVVVKNKELAGIAGLEVYGSYGLLRSLAVQTAYRNQGIAAQLLHEVESLAVTKGLKALYLFTQTAPDYFSRKNYTQISRADVPAEVQQSTEYSHVCPQSAIVMKKVFK